MRIPTIACLAAATAALTACTGADPEPTPDPPAFDAVAQLHDHLVGAFDSEQQSIDEPQYFPIQLVTCDVDAPEIGDVVVYIEQAFMDTPAQPYRQRLYVLTQGDGELDAVTAVYELNAPNAAIGLCDDDALTTFAAADVDLREGCGVYLTWDEDEQAFNGGTVGTDCVSTLNGGSYATSEIHSTIDVLESWDRGFFDDGSQAWGATAGPYLFMRQ
jgi:CpeT protein